MPDLEFHIAHEAGNPTHIFFYKPVDVQTNILKVKILDDYQIDFNKMYQFYLNIGGTNFSFLAQPLKKEGDVYTFLIKESWIELRRYPRIKTSDLGIEVKVKDFRGILEDFSLGGCRVKFRHPITRSAFEGHRRKVILSIKLPGEEEPYHLWADVVSVEPAERRIACEFVNKDERILKLYSKISKMLNERAKKG